MQVLVAVHATTLDGIILTDVIYNHVDLKVEPSIEPQGSDTVHIPSAMRAGRCIWLTRINAITVSIKYERTSLSQDKNSARA